jgi:hypothetical protein
MTISDPSGSVVVDVDAEGRLKDWGLTELFSESVRRLLIRTVAAPRPTDLAGPAP